MFLKSANVIFAKGLPVSFTNSHGGQGIDRSRSPNLAVSLSSVTIAILDLAGCIAVGRESPSSSRTFTSDGLTNSTLIVFGQSPRGSGLAQERFGVRSKNSTNSKMQGGDGDYSRRKHQGDAPTFSEWE